MITITIKDVTKGKNMSLSQLSMETKIPYNTLHKLANNKTESVKFKIIEKICIVLNCTPNDILLIEPQK